MTPTRRDLLKLAGHSAALCLAGAALPSLLLRSALAAGRDADGRVLVVVQLTGGNDGLNTVVPHGDDDYARARPLLRIPPAQVHRINDMLGLHPALASLHRLYADGKVAIVQGVGYPNPNRSHFESMDIWHTATLSAPAGGRSTGWLGRWLDAAPPGGWTDAPAVHLGDDRQPLALASQRVRAATVADPGVFRLREEQSSGATWIDAAIQAARPQADDLLTFMQRSAESALASSRRVQQTLGGGRLDGSYPNSPLARQLQIAAQLIAGGLDTRLYYTAIAGFDTHANQLASHAGLLRQFSDAVAAFIDDLARRRCADRVTVVAFSEFGRRVAENASAGTDHGAAAPMFLVGPKVRAGLIGDHPSLTRLVQGDLIHHTDFRAVYAAVLSRWLGVADPAAILGGQFPTIELFKA
jgi:uncharacterized protein (DUF1501 family)